MTGAATSNSEQQVIVAFHAFMRGALAQAHAEHLVDAEVLASADADVQIVGPSIALYLAALRSTGSPPSISTPHITLSEASSPPSLLRFVQLWAGLVPRIQALSEEHQHDLARLICDLEPESQPILGSLPGLAQDIRAVAIEISQRRTFQERFNEDLQYALDSGSFGRNTVQRNPTARYEPPPMYPDEAGSAPTNSGEKQFDQPPSPPRRIPMEVPVFDTRPLNVQRRPAQPVAGASTQNTPHWSLPLIRETLFAALTDVLYSSPTILSVLQSDTATSGQLSRAYFASVCLAILSVSLDQVDPTTRRVRVVQLGRDSPQSIGVEDCPPHLQPLLLALSDIARASRNIADGDDTRAMRAAAEGRDRVWDPEAEVDGAATEGRELTRMERLRTELERGANWEQAEGRRRPSSARGEVRSLSNKINVLALKFSRIPQFREREEALFEVLVPELAARASGRQHS